MGDEWIWSGASYSVRNRDILWGTLYGGETITGTCDGC